MISNEAIAKIENDYAKIVCPRFRQLSFAINLCEPSKRYLGLEGIITLCIGLQGMPMGPLGNAGNNNMCSECNYMWVVIRQAGRKGARQQGQLDKWRYWISARPHQIYCHEQYERDNSTI